MKESGLPRPNWEPFMALVPKRTCLKKKENKVALLAFDEKEIASQSKWVNGKFNIARCGDILVGTAGANRMSLWNM
jgi:hypothetical protein